MCVTFKKSTIISTSSILSTRFTFSHISWPSSADGVGSLSSVSVQGLSPVSDVMMCLSADEGHKMWLKGQEISQ